MIALRNGGPLLPSVHSREQFLPSSSCRSAFSSLVTLLYAFLGSSGGAAMLNRDARARRQAPPRATLRRSLGLRGGNCAGRRLDSTTKEEEDWPSTDGEETD